MECVREIIDSEILKDIIDLPLELRRKKVQIIVLPVEDRPKGQKLNLGCCPGSPLPDSFFEPLPEEELKAWGL